jgi:hypothetical protein
MERERLNINPLFSPIIFTVNLNLNLSPSTLPLQTTLLYCTPRNITSFHLHIIPAANQVRAVRPMLPPAVPRSLGPPGSPLQSLTYDDAFFIPRRPSHGPSSVVRPYGAIPRRLPSSRVRGARTIYIVVAIILSSALRSISYNHGSPHAPSTSPPSSSRIPVPFWPEDHFFHHYSTSLLYRVDGTPAVLSSLLPLHL